MSRATASAVLADQVARLESLSLQDVERMLGPDGRRITEQGVDDKTYVIDLELHRYKGGGVDVIVGVDDGEELATHPLTELIPIRADISARNAKWKFWA
ncbi:hypothetical protein [Aeromicrobium sp. CTD01-1L150]|uniref:hypothetical protein n=1 Tax=Aeromicrobium sp. CTD01-1L150 TaxID=3341830 RepID=UPI0035C1E824